MNVSDTPYHELQALDRAINSIETDFQTNCKDSFDTNQQYNMFGGIRNTFFDCGALQDADKIKQAYICLQVAISHLLNSVKQVRGDNHIISLASVGLHSLECLYNLKQQLSTSTQQIKPTMSVQQPLLFPPSVPTDADSLMVFTIYGINQQFQTQSQQLSSLTPVISNLSTMSPPSHTNKADKIPI